MRRVEGPAIVLCDGRLRSINGKTAHGLVRGSDRFRIVAVVDPPTSGRDAGEVVDGVRRGIPIRASVAEAIECAAERPRFAIVGVATSGGRFTPDLRESLEEALACGLSVVNGLHERAADHPELAAAAARSGAEIFDIRRPPATRELRFWTGEVLEVPTPRIAVLGTDCAIGKRTTTRLLVEECRNSGIGAEWISTGQTGWLQGAPFGILLDAIPNDFVAGEIEGAVLACARERRTDVIFLEGQSSLRNPSGPCGPELILSAGARGVILQHAPGREFFEGLEERRVAIPPLWEEIEMIGLYGARVLGLTLNGERVSRRELEAHRAGLSAEFDLPVCLPLEEGVAELIPAIRAFLARDGR
jgi:uncharacterized NAD-dependent epimerase/dehydratase family protein